LEVFVGSFGGVTDMILNIDVQDGLAVGRGEVGMLGFEQGL
jgi:hypothetical protein